MKDVRKDGEEGGENRQESPQVGKLVCGDEEILDAGQQRGGRGVDKC